TSRSRTATTRRSTRSGSDRSRRANERAERANRQHSAHGHSSDEGGLVSTVEEAAPRLTRRRRRQLVLGGEYGIFLVIVIALLASADWGQIHTNFANWSIAKGL